MSNIIRLSIDVTKLDKNRFFKGQKGTYCDLVLIPRNETSERGETHIVKQEVTKEERQSRAAPEMPIIGNAREIQKATPAPSKQRAPMPANRRALDEPPAQDEMSDEEIPF
jgi:hypothetical protein